jgi:hypothetical protein
VANAGAPRKRQKRHWAAANRQPALHAYPPACGANAAGANAAAVAMLAASAAHLVGMLPQGGGRMYFFPWSVSMGGRLIGKISLIYFVSSRRNVGPSVLSENA